MGDSLDALVTCDPALSAVFAQSVPTADGFGRYLFIHHVLHAICKDSGLAEPDEQVRGLAAVMWDGLATMARQFWVDRAEMARLVRDREEFLLTRGTTRLSEDHCSRALEALERWKRASTGDYDELIESGSVTAVGSRQKEPNVINAKPIDLLTGEDIVNNYDRAEQEIAKTLQPLKHMQNKETSDPLGARRTQKVYTLTSLTLVESSESDSEIYWSTNGDSGAGVTSTSSVSSNSSDTDHSHSAAKQVATLANTVIPVKESKAVTQDDKASISGHEIGSVELKEGKPSLSTTMPSVQLRASFIDSPALASDTDQTVDIQEAESAVEHEQATKLLFEDENDATNHGDTALQPDETVVDATVPPRPRGSDWAEECQEEADRLETEMLRLQAHAPRKSSIQPTEESPAAASGKATDGMQANDSAELVPTIRAESTNNLGTARAKQKRSLKLQLRGSNSGHKPGHSSRKKEARLHEDEESIGNSPTELTAPSRQSTAILERTPPSISPVSDASCSEFPLEDENIGRNLFLNHALPIICEDMDIYNTDEYALQVGMQMWQELPKLIKRRWGEDARGLRDKSRPNNVYSTTEREQEYRIEVIKALAERNNGEIKYLQEEYIKIRSMEKRRKKHKQRMAMREAASGLQTRHTRLQPVKP